VTSKSCFPNGIELIDAIFDFAITGAAKDYLRMDIGKVSQSLSKTICDKTQFDLENFIISVDSHGIRHIINKHGTFENEALRGQMLVQKRALWRLPQILELADKIEIVGKSAIGNDLILFEKTIANQRYFTIWEIRIVKSLKKQKKKQSRIMLHTLYIRQA
jgi:hypothetical protein